MIIKIIIQKTNKIYLIKRINILMALELFDFKVNEININERYSFPIIIGEK